MPLSAKRCISGLKPPSPFTFPWIVCCRLNLTGPLCPSMGSVVGQVPEDLSLPTKGNRPTDIVEVSEKVEFYHSRPRRMVKERTEDAEREFESTDCYTDPALKVKAVLLRLTTIMFLAGMIDFAAECIH